MACSTKVLRTTSITWDVLLMIFGCVIISFGVYALYTIEQFNTPLIALIGIGIATFLVAAFGLLSAIRESSRLLKTFAIILFILIILQVLVIGIFLIFKTPILVKVDERFDQLWFDQPIPIKPGSVTKIASVERYLGCCGNNGPSDYILPPNSCYTNNDKLNLNGCRVEFLTYINDRWNTFNLIVLVLVLVEIICGFLAYVLANSILNRWRRSNYFPK